jgi:hypothetical protein
LNLPRDESFEVIITLPKGYYHGRGWKNLAVVCEGAFATEVRKIKLKKGKFCKKGVFSD